MAKRPARKMGHLRCGTVGDFVANDINATISRHGDDRLEITKINTCGVAKFSVEIRQL